MKTAWIDSARHILTSNMLVLFMFVTLGSLFNVILNTVQLYHNREANGIVLLGNFKWFASQESSYRIGPVGCRWHTWNSAVRVYCVEE